MAFGQRDVNIISDMVTFSLGFYEAQNVHGNGNRCLLGSWFIDSIPPTLFFTPLPLWNMLNIPGSTYFTDNWTFMLKWFIPVQWGGINCAWVLFVNHPMLVSDCTYKWCCCFICCYAYCRNNKYTTTRQPITFDYTGFAIQFTSCLKVISKRIQWHENITCSVIANIIYRTCHNKLLQ